MKKFLIAALFGIGLGATPAMAQGVVQEADKTIYKKKTSIDFSDVNISGELTKPEGAYVGVRKNVKFKNFIKVRQNFRPEIFASADNI